MAAHAKIFSPSKMAKVLYCTASVAHEVDAPNTSSDAACEGSCAHALQAVSLITGQPCGDFKGHTWQGLETRLADLNFETAPTLGVDGQRFKVDEEMIDHIQGSVDRVNERKGVAGELKVETRVSFTDFTTDGLADYDDGFGTSDAIVVNDSSIDVIDLKYGRGKVYAATPVEDDCDQSRGLFVTKDKQLYQVNDQGLAYALGSFLALQQEGKDLNTINIIIDQPRLDHYDTISITPKELRSWAHSTLRKAAVEILTGDTVYHAGEKQCQWCSFKGDCTAHATFALKGLAEDFEQFLQDDGDTPTFTLQPAERLTLAQMSHIWLKSSAIKKAIESIGQALEAKARNGTAIPQLKLVRKTTRLQWKPDINDETLYRALMRQGMYKTDQYQPAKRKTVLQTAKLLEGGRNNPILERYIEKPEGDLMLAAMTDKRKAVHLPTPDEDFDQLESTEDAVSEWG